MKIDFEGQVRVLDLEHIKLKHAVAIQGFTGLALLDWQRALISRDGETPTALADPGWIMNMAAAWWLMLAQNGQDAPPLDDDVDCDVIGFALALYAAAVEEVKARKVPDQPDPTALPGRPAPSSRQTASPKTEAEIVPLPLPTGS